jgi:hypothetical protein
MDGGGIAEAGRGAHIVNGEPNGPLAAGVPDREVTASADSGRCWIAGPSPFSRPKHQLSDYRVDDSYIQAHIHGLSSRSVLDLDDLPTVLRDEAVNAAAALRG